jgi:hypothetical protein
MPNPMDANRRTFIQSTVAAGAAGSLPILGQEKAQDPKADYNGPNLIIIRFGGGARRLESIDRKHTHAPFLAHKLSSRGVLFNSMEIDHFDEGKKANGKPVDTSHGQGTIYIMSGSYKKLRTVGSGALDERFVPSVPTLFEYFRSKYKVDEHQALIINSEDRKQEEFLTYSNHVRFGIDDKCQILSLYRFKRYLFSKLLEEGKREGREITVKERRQIQQQYDKLAAIDRRGKLTENPRLMEFWARWRHHYGDSGLKNPRGDRLLTELTLRSMRELQPRMMMVNYTDCDYVHWGIRSHYFNALGIMDQGIRQIVAAAKADEFYRDNTLFVIVPDCGRDNDLLADIPFQHHFNTKSAHKIFALFFGKGVPAGEVFDKGCDQTQIAGTVGKLMGFDTDEAESRILEEAIA